MADTDDTNRSGTNSLSRASVAELQRKKPMPPEEKARAIMRQLAPEEVEGGKRKARMDRAIDDQTGYK